MPELYSLRGCPYCAAVERKLAELGLEFERHPVPLRRGNRERVREVSGQTGVPVLVDHEEGVDGMAESDQIIAYLERTYG